MEVSCDFLLSSDLCLISVLLLISYNSIIHILHVVW